MFEFTPEWAAGMIIEALVARGVPEDEARAMADMTGYLARTRAGAWDEGYACGQTDYENEADNPYRAEQS